MDKLPPGITQADVEGFMQLTQANQPSAPVANQAKLPPGITQDDVEGFMQLSQANQPVAPAPIQAPVAPRIVGPVDTSMNRRESLNNQSAGINYTQDDIDLQMYNGLMNAAKKGATSQADYWNQFNPAQKARVGKLLAGVYSQAPDQDKGIISNIITGLGNSARDTLDTTGQIINYATGDKEKFAAKSLEIQRNKANEEIRDSMNPSTVRDIAKVGGDVAQFFIPGVGEAATIVGKGGAALLAKAPLIGKAVEAAPNLTNYAIQGAGASVLQTPATGNPENFVSEKLGQAGAGAVAGGVGGIAADKVLGYVGSKIEQAKKIKNSPLNPDDQAFAETAQKAGIDELLVNDYPSAKSKLVKQVQTASRVNEDVSDKVIAQQKQVNASVNKIISDAPSPDIAKIAEDTGLNKVLPDSPHYKKAQEIAKKIDSVDPSDPNAILKVSNEAKFIANKNESTLKYDEADKIIPADTKVPFNNIENVLEKAKKHYDDLPFASDKTAFKSVIDDLDSAVAGLKSGKNSFTQVSNVFKSAGAKARDATKGGRDLEAAYFNELKSAVTKDKEAYVNSLPDKTLVKKYNDALMDANNYNRLNVQNIKKDEILFKAFSDENRKGIAFLPDGIIEKWVTKGNTSKLKQLWNQTPESGKQAVQQGIINKFKANSLDKKGDIDYQKYIDNYKSYINPVNGQTPLDIVFDPATKQAMQNLIKTLENFKNYGYNKMNPQNGSLAVDAIKSGNANTLIGAAKYIASYLKSQLLVKGITDKKFQRILLNAQNINPSRPAYAERLGEIASYMSSSLYNNNKDK